MIKNRKVISLIIAALMVLSLAAACTGTQTPTPTQTSTATAEKVNINIGTLKGPTGIGMVELMKNNDAGTAANNYNFTLSGTPDELSTKIINGELDIAALPLNLASILYNKTSGKMQLAAINTLGVLYILDSSNQIKTVADLKGKTIYATGKGSTPEYVLNYILNKNNIIPGKDVTIEYKSEHAELATLMKTGKVSIGMLPEPFVTSTTLGSDNIKVAIDITKEFEKVAGSGNQLVMGCIVVRSEFAQKNKAALDAFLSEYAKSTEFVNKNIDEASVLCKTYGIMDSAVAKIAIPKCNMVYIDGSEMKKSADNFLNILFNAEPKSVGGKLPDEAFYYQK